MKVNSAEAVPNIDLALALFKSTLFGEQWLNQNKTFEQTQYQYLRIVIRAMGRLKEPLSVKTITLRVNSSEQLFIDYCTFLVSSVSLAPKVDFEKISHIEKNIDFSALSAEVRGLSARTVAFLRLFDGHPCDEPIFLVLAQFIRLPLNFCLRINQDASAIITSMMSINSTSSNAV
ncbi:hypothetical protein [Shewanella colwelliana]|uniref:hypothetical protein n=1 Tax=Shewanella colwelliana TaxID=23 RepID=UPI003735DF79